MDEFSQHPFSFLSYQQLFEELENIVALESQKTENPWISTVRLSGLFCAKYGVALKDVTKTLGHGNNLRCFLKSGNCFSIYGTQNPQECYVALLRSIVPEFQQFPTSVSCPIQDRIKRYWKVDRRMKMRKTEVLKRSSATNFKTSHNIVQT